MKASSAFPTSLTLSTEDAKDVLLAETLEQTESQAGHWTDGESAAASRDAKELAGDSAKPAVYLAIRARLVLARLKAFVPDQEKLRDVRFNTWPLILGLVLLAYLGGALTDRFATEGARINLLSPPVLLLLVWNMLVYLGLILGAIGLMPKATFSPVGALTSGFSHMKWTGLDKKAPKAMFAARWTALQQSRLRLEASRAFHLASFAFAVGLLTSIAVRGIGTAYTVGWESTWFGEKPEWIALILRALYDLVPLEWFGQAAWPDTETIAGLRFDRLDSNVANTASDWLLRLMLTLSTVILLPRLLLVGISSMRLTRRKKSVVLETGSAYYRGIFTADKLPQKTSVLVVDHAGDVGTIPAEWLTLKSELQTPTLIVANAWEGDIVEKLNALPTAAAYDFLIGLDPTGTPEEEVHGHLIDSIRDFSLSHASSAPLAVLNLTPLIRRHGSDADKVGSRRALWESFAHRHGVSAVALNLDDRNALKSLHSRLFTPTERP